MTQKLMKQVKKLVKTCIFLLKMSKKVISQVKLDIPVYKRSKLPTSLKNIQITKPGSRYLR